MIRAWRTRSWRLAAVAATVVVAVVANTGSANADYTGNSITGTCSAGSIACNSSDPELIQCPRADGTGMTLCLFTSEDMGTVATPYTGGTGWTPNYYPMYRAKLWRLKDGADASLATSWTPMGTVLDESTLTSRLLVSPGTDHFWAPGVVYWDNEYWLTVPDVVDPTHESTSSRVFTFYTADDPLGAQYWHYYGEVQSPAGGPNGGYMSDPEIFLSDGWDPYMAYANGDSGNCGGISIGHLDYYTALSFVDTPKDLTITGWPSGMATCVRRADGSTVNRPYMEGAKLYTTSQLGVASGTAFKYVLIFAAKPEDGGALASTCGSANEAIAYATSKTIEGDYAYGGLLMCGAASGEYTNQVSVVQHPRVPQKYVFAWADGDGTNRHNRQTHLMCLKWTTLFKAPLFPTIGYFNPISRSSANLSNC